MCPGVAEGPKEGGQNAAMTSPAQPTGEERKGLGTTPPHRGARKHPCKACLNKSSDLWQPRAVVTADPAVPSAVQVDKLPQVRAPPTQVGETCRAEAGLGTTAQEAKLKWDTHRWGGKPEAKAAPGRDGGMPLCNTGGPDPPPIRDQVTQKFFWDALGTR